MTFNVLRRLPPYKIVLHVVGKVAGSDDGLTIFHSRAASSREWSKMIKPVSSFALKLILVPSAAVPRFCQLPLQGSVCALLIFGLQRFDILPVLK